MEQAHGVRVKNLWEKEFGIKILTFSEIRESGSRQSEFEMLGGLGGKPESERRNPRGRNPKAGKLESEWIMPEPRFGKPDGSCWEDLGLGVRIGTCIHGRYTERMIRGGLRRED